jgi:hypothetical protein
MGDSVVDETVDPAERLDGRRDHRVDLILLLDVADHAVIGDAEPVELRARLGHEIFLPLGHDDLGAALPEVARHALADALARSGDDDDLALDGMHVVRVRS